MSPTEIELPDAAQPPSATGSPSAADDSRDVLFEGDEGLLPAEVRNTLARLLSTRFIDGVRNPAWWVRVQRHEDILRSRLNDLYLELVLDRRREVAFTQQVDLGEDVPILLRKEKPLSLPAAILLLHLRQEYDRGAVEGRDVVVDHADLLDHLEVWKDVDDQNPATFRKRCEAAITTVREKGILVVLTAERYRISGVIYALLTAEKVDAMTTAFEEMAAADQGADESSTATTAHEAAALGENDR